MIIHTKKEKSLLGKKIGSPLTHAKAKNMGETITNLRPADVRGGIVSTTSLIPSHVVAQARQTTTKRKTKVILANHIDFLSEDNFSKIKPPLSYIQNWYFF